MTAIYDDAREESRLRQHICRIPFSNVCLLATGAIGAGITRQPSDNAAKLVGTPNAALRVLASPLVNETGLLVHKCPRQPYK